jgi:NadR type nicotinamide-nucleotide adenylyltransferase
MKSTSVIIFGKFLPPHKGHVGLIKHALDNYGEDCQIVVILCATIYDYIPAETRKQWLELLCTGIIVEIVWSDHLPQTTEATKENAEAWVNELINGPNQIDKKYNPKWIMSSEKYGWTLQEAYWPHRKDIYPIVFDESRWLNPVSATQIRQNPISYWEFVPEPIRKYLVTKICIIGPESTGKTTLTKSIANILECPYVEEQARPWLIDQKPLEGDFNSIALLHAGKVLEACTQSKNGLVIVDTDAYTTEMYYRRYGYGKSSNELIKLIANEVKYDFYLLTHPTIPYEKDELREFEDFQLDILQELKDHLEFEKLPFHEVKLEAAIPRTLDATGAIYNFLHSR